MSKIKTILSIIFIFTIWGCASSAYPIILWWSRECVLNLIIIIKPEVWIINHCLGLGHETMVCAVCLTMFLCHVANQHVSRNADSWLYQMTVQLLEGHGICCLIPFFSLKNFWNDNITKLHFQCSYLSHVFKLCNQSSISRCHAHNSINSYIQPYSQVTVGLATYNFVEWWIMMEYMCRPVLGINTSFGSIFHCTSKIRTTICGNLLDFCHFHLTKE